MVDLQQRLLGDVSAMIDRCTVHRGGCLARWSLAFSFGQRGGKETCLFFLLTMVWVSEVHGDALG